MYSHYAHYLIGNNSKGTVVEENPNLIQSIQSTDSTSEAKPDLSCYIHAVSPVKKADTSERRFFYLILQQKDESVRAVCFSPEKQAELKTLEKVKSPV